MEYENDTLDDYSSSSERYRTRHVNIRTLRVEPQFNFDETYITIFSERRIYDPDGDIHYDPIKPRRTSTRVEMFDAFRYYLDEGKSSLRNFCRSYGLTVPYLHGLIFCLTGMDATDYRLSWQMKRADELLRYTNLSIPEVARMSGVGTPPNLFYAYQRDYDCSPSERRRAIRQPNDVGRFR